MRKKVALVLSSGGARGLAHIGVIEELENQGFEITSVAGTSIGSLIGGFYAAGKLQEYTKWQKELDKMDVIRLLDFSMSTKGFIKGEKIMAELQKIVPDTNIENLRIPFSAVAVDLSNLCEVVFSSGSMYQAIRASVAIPAVLFPLKTGSSELVDGGIRNPLPINAVKRNENDIVVAVSLNALIPYENPFLDAKEKNLLNENQRLKAVQQIKEKWQKLLPDTRSNRRKLGYIEIVTRSFEFMQEKISSLIVEHHQPEIFVPVSRRSCGTFDFYKAEELIEYGKYQCKKALNDYISKNN